jgi:glycolate oxidase iron-sulfur subunit
VRRRSNGFILQDRAATSTLSPILAREEQKILACVHCGLCLEACPTYVATADENDGPRGRIYLMRAVEEGRLASTSTSFQTHIDRCLGCRACEAACPAGVEYGQLLEAARFEIMQTRPKRGAAYKLLRFALKHVWLKPGRLRTAFALARLVRNSGLANLLLKTTLPREMSPQFEFGLALLEGSKGPGTSTRGGSAPLTQKTNNQNERNTALLFKACVTAGLFERVNDATRRVLAVNGCELAETPGQECCGALHAHAGDLDGARILARRNIDAFQKGEAPIITNAGGCGAMLVSYAHLLADDPQYSARAKEFSARIRDIGQHLAAIGFRNGANIGFARTTYDASCHLLHGQRATDTSLKMLWAIPDLNFAILRDSDVCCGGAGVYNLLEPALSQEVLKEKLRHIKASGAEILATGNAGCQMQIAAGAKLAGVPVQVCHPVELLDEAYARAGLYQAKESFEL